jgi:prolyl-tRNA synthetase
MVGGLIMTHGDDSGLILPPRVAPYQVVIVPIAPRKGDWNEAILPRAREVAAGLRAAGVRVHVDDRDTYQTGYKYADWEMRGVPLRLELGPKDVEKSQCILVRRDTREKTAVALAGLPEHVSRLLEAIQAALLERARRFVADSTRRVDVYDEFKSIMAERRGFLLAGWCRDAACEATIKEETRATVRVMSKAGESEPGACVRCGKPSPGRVHFAQAY